MLKNAVNLIVAAALIASLAPIVHADFMTDNGMGLNETVRLHAAGTLADNLSVYAGQNKINFQGHDFLGYCVDITQYAGSADVTVNSVANLPHGSAIAYLLNTYAANVATNHDAAVLAVSIWEVLSETTTSFNVSGGYFTVTDNPGVVADANVMLAGIPTNYQPANWPSVLHSDCVQDMAVLTYGTPEPATIGLLSLGAVGMLWRTRRERGAR